MKYDNLDKNDRIGKPRSYVIEQPQDNEEEWSRDEDHQKDMTEIVKTSNPKTTPGEIKSQDKKKSYLFGYQGQ